MRAKHIRTYDKREIKSTQKWRLIDLTHTKKSLVQIGKAVLSQAEIVGQEQKCPQALRKGFK